MIIAESLAQEWHNIKIAPWQKFVTGGVGAKITTA